ncbi:hypothetical protein [Mycobacterium sp.]|uniref:hypothetical protein n=1 Tax=Mycobacterium sp. TaxID=1785 RepID=UPI002CA18C86|nr:hypothetical protein [Mycobacterium sp.]HME49443.1 hypothetical protein [Mycobacterium sp.]
MTSITRTKMYAATFGAGVVLTMGALTVAAGNTEAHATSPTSNGASVTSVQATPPSAPATPVAVPTVLAKKFAGKDWNGE